MTPDPWVLFWSALAVGFVLVVTGWACAKMSKRDPPERGAP